MLDKIQPKTFGFIVELMSNKGKSSRGRKKSDFEKAQQTSSVVQWLGINLPTQGTQVPSLVQEDPACLGVTRPCAPAAEPTCCNYCFMNDDVPVCLEPVLCNKKGPCDEKPVRCKEEQPRLLQLKKAHIEKRTQCGHKKMNQREHMEKSLVLWERSSHHPESLTRCVSEDAASLTGMRWSLIVALIFIFS